MSAENLVELASIDPERTLRAAAGKTTLEARHAISLAHVELGRLPDALRHARAGLKAAAGTAPGEWAARFRLTLAWIELDRGSSAASLRHLDAAEPLLRGQDAARARCLRGLNLCQTAEPRLAIAELSSAVRELRRHGDHRWLANALVGRGIARSYALRLAEADSDFHTAHGLLTGLGEHDRAAMCLHNRGFVATVAGRLPTALGYYEQAAEAGLDSARRPEALLDRAEALIAAGLISDAHRVLRPAWDMLRRCGRGSRLPDALLLAARCAMRERDFTRTVELADEAARLFRHQRRRTWVPVASALCLRARLASGDRSVLAAARRIARACVRQDRRADAAELRMAAAQVSPDPVALLELVAAERTSTTGGLRAIGWHAQALLARRRGDRRAALAACRNGLRADQGITELAELAVELAWETGRARSVLRWTEHHRAALLTHPPVLPPDNPALAGALAELRMARTRGKPTEPLERRVRRLALTNSDGEAPCVPAAEDMVESLQDRVLVSYFLHNGQVRALSVVAGTVRRHTIGPADLVAEQVRSLRFALTLRRDGAADPHMIDRLLFDPVRELVSDRPLVVVPAGSLDRLPWSALPTCLERPLSVVPSVRCWLRALSAQRSGDHTAWIAGPALRHATREAAALHRDHGGTLLIGRSSTVGATLAAMDGAAVAHIAAHGSFRADQPMFSHVRLADGPLYGYDLERLHRAPRVVVLSSCDAGLASVLLRRGTSAVIASLLPVPDDRAVPFMTQLHSALRSGMGPAAALATAQRREDLGFVCFGAG